MDSAEQANGEKQVKELLIEPLERRGLAKPATLTKVQFAAMIADVAGKLAYMTPLNLQALEEEMGANPGGKEKDRFPIANKILEAAARIQPPGDDASPLMRAVFSSQLGLDAIAGGWAPELLGELRRNRKWPGAYTVTNIKNRASDNIRQLRAFEDELARGNQLSAPQAEWRNRRVAALRKCEQISEMNGAGA